jgi:hypothetical protein
MKQLTVILLLAAAIAAGAITLGARSVEPAGASSATAPAAAERAHVRIPLKRAQCRRLFAHDEPRNLGPCLAAATR